MVHQLVLLEALGPWSQPAEAAPSILAKSLTAKPRTTQRCFASAEEAAAHRSKRNLFGVLPIDAARVLCRRGVAPARRDLVGEKGEGEGTKGGKGDKGDNGGVGGRDDVKSSVVTWAADHAGLNLPSRMKLDEAQSVAFLTRIKARTMLVLCRDGIFTKRFPFIWWCHASPLGFLGRALLRTMWGIIVLLRAVVRWAPPLQKQLAGPLKKNLRMVEAAWNMLLRLDLLHATHKDGLAYAELPRGGHHPQLTMPEEVSEYVMKWRRK
jgi:hypothetical protein